MTAITNSNAETREASGSEICDRSGTKAYPHELVKDPHSKNMVLPWLADTQIREYMSYKSQHTGQTIHPEPADNFISTAVLVSDL